MLLRHGGPVLRLLRDATTCFYGDTLLESTEFVYCSIGQAMAQEFTIFVHDQACL